MATSLMPTFATLTLCCCWFWSVCGVFNGENFTHDHLSSVNDERPLIPRSIILFRRDDASVLGSADPEYIEEGTRHIKKIKSNVEAEQVSSGHNTLLRNSSPDQIEKLMSEPGLRDFPCPIATEIAPCLCSYDKDFNVDLDCTAVASEDQLAAVFEQEFPATNLRRFSMSSNSHIEVLRNILNGITFQEITLYPGPFALKEVSEYFLLSIKETLISFFVQNSYLDSDSFPFYTLSELKELTNIDVYRSNMSWIPELQGPNLKIARFHKGFIDNIVPGTFGELPSLMTVDLNHNLIGGLEAGTFPIRGRDTTVLLYDNSIGSVQPGTFYFEYEDDSSANASIQIELHNNRLQSLQAGTFPFRDGCMTVYLQDNQISSIEPGTFVMPNSTVSLSVILQLDNNYLTTFGEDVFGELLPYTTQIILHGNPFDCGCDVAWLVLNPFHMLKVDNRTTCRDGTNFHDLDPKAFWNICRKPTLTIGDVWNRALAGGINIMKSIFGS